MGNAARKARKRAGIQFVHPAKTPTPFFDRSIFHLIRDKKNGDVRESSKARAIRAELKKQEVTQ
jgi:hypothetical protein